MENKILGLLLTIVTLPIFAVNNSLMNKIEKNVIDGVTFTSPDGHLKVNIKGEKQLSYTIYEGTVADVEGVYAIDNNISMEFEGLKQGKYTISAPKHVKESFTAMNYKLTSFTGEYNQVIAKNSNGVNVEFRIYNEGVAYRFFTTSTKKEWKVKNEVAEFNFPNDNIAYLPYSTSTSNPKSTAFQSTYDVAPLSQTKSTEAFLPAMVDCKKAKVTILETDVEGYPGMFILPGNKKLALGVNIYGLCADFAKYPKSFTTSPWRMQRYVAETEDFIAKGKGQRTFPWRILAISHDDTEMPTNTLAYQLASPSRLKGNLSWIKPGKVAWDWWNDWGLTGVDFSSGINQQTYKYYIDFASKNGIEYIILDEGWYVPKSGDMLTVVPELDLPELVKYGKSKNVDIILWTVFNVLDDQLDEACEKYSKMGIKGFKVDFLDRFDQDAVDMAYRIAERCSKSKLVLDYHGVFPPQGITRTYPNVINFEAIFGMEEVKWTQRVKHEVNGRMVDEPEKNMPEFDVTFPYLRGMVGPVDFTPGGMRNATKNDFQPVYSNPVTMGTRCHQLAHYIVHESPLTMLADNPTIYMKEQECTDFITSLPTVYDEMQCVAGEVGKYIVMARRQGKKWYLAGQTNWDSRDIKVAFDFLPSGNYKATIFQDGTNADKNASDYSVRTINVDRSTILNMHLASGGGFAIKIN